MPAPFGSNKEHSQRVSTGLTIGSRISVRGKYRETSSQRNSYRRKRCKPCEHKPNVAEGLVDWKKADWTAIGCSADKNSKVFLKDYPRWKANGNGSDCAYVVVNGVNVTLHGTSNQNAEEYARYQQKGNGTPRTRTTAPVVDTKNKETAIALFKSRSDWLTWLVYLTM